MNLMNFLFFLMLRRRLKYPAKHTLKGQLACYPHNAHTLPGILNKEAEKKEKQQQQNGNERTLVQ